MSVGLRRRAEALQIVANAPSLSPGAGVTRQAAELLVELVGVIEDLHVKITVLDERLRLERQARQAIVAELGAELADLPIALYTH